MRLAGLGLHPGLELLAFAVLRILLRVDALLIALCLERTDPRVIGASSICPAGGPLELLYERPEGPRFGIPGALAACYGGDLGFSAPCLYANFVASVDGVVALGSGEESGGVISGHCEADHFVMGLLRACADAVLIGAGTFRKAPTHLWHAEHVYPAAASLFALLRRQLGLAPQPLLIVVSSSGELAGDHAAFRHPTLIVTTPVGEAQLKLALPAQVRFSVSDAAPIPVAAIMDAYRGLGSGRWRRADPHRPSPATKSRPMPGG